MKKIRKKKKIEAAAAITAVILALYLFATVPVIIADDPSVVTEDPVYISEVTVTLTATDDMSGVAHTYYAVDPAIMPPVWTEYTGPFVVKEPGKHTIHYYSIDNAGNEEVVQMMSFVIENKDITPPETTCTLEGEIKTY